MTTITEGYIRGLEQRIRELEETIARLRARIGEQEALYDAELSRLRNENHRMAQRISQLEGEPNEEGY